MDYKSLRISVSWKYRIKYSVFNFTQKLLYHTPFICRGLRFSAKMCNLLGNLDQKEKVERKAINLLKIRNQNSQQFGSEYGYSDAVHELVTTDAYYKQLKQGNFRNIKSESSMLYDSAIKEATSLFEEDQKIKSFLNFGVCYAYVDSVLAELHPEISFTGIDRSMFTKLYNQEYFSYLKNMEFIAGDIFDLLSKKRFDGGVFFIAGLCVFCL